MSDSNASPAASADSARGTFFPSLLAGGIGSALAVVLFSSTGHDDCHITFWSAWSLAELGEILNHSGQRVEQSSSLLQTVLLALGTKVTGIAIPWLAYAFGILAAVLTVVRLPVLARVLGWRPTFARTLLLATTPGFAYWQLGMLESSLFTFLAVELLIRLARSTDPGRATSRGGWVGLFGWTLAFASVRPEASMVALAVSAAMVVAALLPAARRESSTLWRRPTVAFAFAALSLGLLMAFRKAYFGSLFPHPVASKVGSSDTNALHELGVGLAYLVERLTAVGGGVLLVALVTGIAFGFRDLVRGRVARLVPVLFVGAYAGFLITAGGDWMYGWRFVAHMEPVVVFLLLQVLASLALEPALERGLVGLALAANALGLVTMAATVSTGMPIWTAWQMAPAVEAFANEDATWPERANQIHLRDVVMVDEMNDVIERLLEHQDSVSILSKQAGLVLYYAAKEHQGKLEFYDRLGLVSTHYDEIKEEYGIPSGQFGLTWTIYDVFWLAKMRDDATLHPDVIFDIHENSATFLETRDYTVVYEQTGTVDCGYLARQEILLEFARAGIETEGDEVVELDAAEPDPSLTPQERQAENKRRRQEKKHARFRDRMAKRLPESRPFWRSSTNMYQYIAVRSELAERAGMIPVSSLREVVGDNAPVTRHNLDWDDARRPYLRTLGEDLGGEVGQRIGDPTRVVGFDATMETKRGGRQRVVVDAEDAIPGTLYVSRVVVGDRELELDDQYQLRRNGTRTPEVVLLEAADVRRKEAVRIRGYTIGEKPYSVRAAVRGGGNE